MNVSKLMVIVIALQLFILAGQWNGGGGGGGYVQPAMAQVSDPGAQRIEIIGQLKDLNSKADQLIAILESGQLQVRLATPDDKKE